MQALVINYKKGVRTMKGNQIIVEVKEIKDRKSAAKLVGKGVIYLTRTKKQIKGRIASAHGNSGAMRALFRKGLPGDVIGEKVEILE